FARDSYSGSTPPCQGGGESSILLSRSISFRFSSVTPILRQRKSARRKPKSRNSAKARAIVVAVGTTRRPKLAAVREALDAMVGALHPGSKFRVVAVDVLSGVRHTPLSREETMAGARARARELLRIALEGQHSWHYFVGL